MPDATWAWLQAYLGRDAPRALLIETGSIAGSKQTLYTSVMTHPQVLAALKPALKRNPKPAHFDVYLQQQTYARVRPLLPPGGPEINKAFGDQQDRPTPARSRRWKRLVPSWPRSTLLTHSAG